jgi:plastocyanin
MPSGRGVAQKGPPISARTHRPGQPRAHTATLPDPVVVAHRLIAALGALLLVAATMVFGAPAGQAATSATADAATPKGSAKKTIAITDELSVAHLSVTPGTTVTWVNKDDDSHRVMSAGRRLEFDSGELEPGERFTHTFRSVGDVTYHDHFNMADPAYMGMVMVEKGAAASRVGMSTTSPVSPTAVTPALATGAQQRFETASDEDEEGGSVTEDYIEVEIHNANEFRPATVTIGVGGTVEWYNDHSDIHTATGAGGIDSGDLDRDERYSKTFNKPGTYQYVCIYHERMVATVKVANKNGKVPPPPKDDGGTPPPPSGGGGQQVAISIGSTFNPGQVTVPAGSVVTWTNNDGAPHTATGQGFDSGMLTTGQRYSHTFSTPGTYAYDCAYHSNMTGTIRVESSNGEVPPPPPPGEEEPPPPPNNPPPPDNPPPGNGGGGGSNAPARAAVTMDDDFFSPRTVTVRVGGVVTWTNRGNYHTATASNGAFDSGMVDTGQTFKHKFTKAGTYGYRCILHDGMTGTVKVVNASGEAPPPGKTPGGKGGKKPGGGSGGPGGGAGGGAGGGTGPGGGSGSAPSAPSVGSKTHTITMGASSFSPKVVNARVGDKVIFRNGSSAPHNVNGGSAFKSPMVMGGQSFETVLTKQGTVNYKCDYHPGMTGTIKVAAAPAGVKVPPPSAGGGVSGPVSGALPAAPSGGSSSSSSGSSSSGGAPSPTAESHTISMVNSTFDPQVLQARVGDEVTWVNDDPIPHNVSGGPLDSGMMMGGAEFTTVLTEAGTIEYECTLHPGMTGTLEVAEALPGTEVPPASSSTTSSGSSSSSSGAESAGGGESTPSAKPEAGSKNHVVDIVDFLYEPDPLEVHVGDTVTFVNKDAAPHTATADDKSWDSGNMEQGDEWTLEVEEEGEIPYFCIYHPNMTGTLIVKPKNEELAAPGAGSDEGSSSDTAQMSAGNIAGFSSGWLALLAFLAGMQLQSRWASRRNPTTADVTAPPEA